MAALALPRRFYSQPQHTVEVDPSWAQSIFFAQVDSRIYANNQWSEFVHTSAQPRGVNKFGTTIQTTGESTPDAVSVVSGTTFQEWSVAHVLELVSGATDVGWQFASTAT